MALGKVYLIGVGPGAADLITLRGLRAIRKAEVLILDSLLPDTFLRDLGVSTKDKKIRQLRRGDNRKTQDEINRMVLEEASSGKSVARIKTGDPHIFGRGLEEQNFLTENGITWEVIPGLSVLNAGPALLDYALTSRNAGKSFAAASARCAGGEINHNFPKADSLIIFMGMSVLEQVTKDLSNQGWSEDSPAVVIERASMPWQKQASGKLSSIAETANKCSLGRPAILVVGRAANEMYIHNPRPKILFTGLDPANFQTLGAIVHWPAIKAEPYKEGILQLPLILNRLSENKFKFVIFTSKTTVRYFFDALSQNNLDSRILSGVTVITAGKGTREELREQGITANIAPEHMGSAGIIEKTYQYQDSGEILLIQSATATEKLANELAAKLGKVTRLLLHHVIPHPELGKPLPMHDIIYFTCPSGVRAYWQKYGKDAFKKKVWCIGDVTLNQLSEYGVQAKVVVPDVS